MVLPIVLPAGLPGAGGRPFAGGCDRPASAPHAADTVDAVSEDISSPRAARARGPVRASGASAGQPGPRSSPPARCPNWCPRCSRRRARCPTGPTGSSSSPGRACAASRTSARTGCACARRTGATSRRRSPSWPSRSPAGRRAAGWCSTAPSSPSARAACRGAGCCNGGPRPPGPRPPCCAGPRWGSSSATCCGWPATTSPPCPTAGAASCSTSSASPGRRSWSPRRSPWPRPRR